MPQQRNERWRKAQSKLDATTLADQARALRQEMNKNGISVSEAIPRIVAGFLPRGKNPTVDQVRTLATSLAQMLEISEERFVDLWLDSLRRD